MVSSLALGASFAVGASALPNPTQYFAGFNNAIVSSTLGGAATCIQGTIPVAASAMNIQLNFPTPANQSVVTETIVEFLQVNTTLPEQVMGGKHNVSGTYNIGAKLCYPTSSGSPNASLIQFLTHGVGFDKSYWDFFSADYSYQNAAALVGYTTLAYDRLGIGASDHPDPIQIVQTPLEIAIGHSLVQMLRNGAVSNTKFQHVIGVGHSLGSELTNAVTAQYPKDFDAAVLTGFSVNTAGQPVFFSSLDLVIARENVPYRFPTLNNGYLISESINGNQFAFFRAQNYLPAILVAAETAKQTFTIGELFTNSMFQSVAKEFTGPIDVVDGENDLPFCQSNCLVPENKAAAVKGALYPNAKASSAVYVAPGAGHGLNLHYVAGEAYRHIFQFLKSNGF
ncbi:uncharacterized protein PAC_04477 [Phialocephala subalpina]|uniref:AB hydrolase-1 domain-containing protein n=1 Tax=Phialocephala subalpina TaxID=576137 RepID=A0A1L7WP95_9HELO|nr:uncharacterized protein PAC_04477 [Phialocephala subalpina]